MLLTGTHPRTLDEKKRLALPKRVREQLGEAVDRLYVTPGPDQCLLLFGQAELERLAEKLGQVPATDAEARVRLFFAQMETVDIDGNGRILLPDRLVDFAKLEHEVVLIGVRDHLELWDERRWDQYLRRHGTRK